MSIQDTLSLKKVNARLENLRSLGKVIHRYVDARNYTSTQQQITINLDEIKDKPVVYKNMAYDCYHFISATSALAITDSVCFKHGVFDLFDSLIVRCGGKDIVVTQSFLNIYNKLRLDLTFDLSDNEIYDLEMGNDTYPNFLMTGASSYVSGATGNWFVSATGSAQKIEGYNPGLEQRCSGMQKWFVDGSKRRDGITPSPDQGGFLVHVHIPLVDFIPLFDTDNDFFGSWKVGYSWEFQFNLAITNASNNAYLRAQSTTAGLTSSWHYQCRIYYDTVDLPDKELSEIVKELRSSQPQYFTFREHEIASISTADTSTSWTNKKIHEGIVGLEQLYIFGYATAELTGPYNTKNPDEILRLKNFRLRVGSADRFETPLTENQLFEEFQRCATKHINPLTDKGKCWINKETWMRNKRIHGFQLGEYIRQESDPYSSKRVEFSADRSGGDSVSLDLYGILVRKTYVKVSRIGDLFDMTKQSIPFKHEASPSLSGGKIRRRKHHK